jgi:hypothetical protein
VALSDIPTQKGLLTHRSVEAETGVCKECRAIPPLTQSLIRGSYTKSVLHPIVVV